MQMIGRTRPFSAATSRRSIRFGFSRGSATLATISNWSTLATRTCWRPRTAREIVPCRGSTRSISPSLDCAFSPQRKSTRSPATTGLRSLGAERFQDPPRGTLIGGAVVGQHRAGQPEDREHAAAAADRQVDLQQHVKRNLGVAQLRRRLGRVNRAVAIHFASAADPLFRFRGLLLKTVLVKLPRPVGLASTRCAILAKFSPELLLFRHQYRPENLFQ